MRRGVPVRLMGGCRGPRLTEQVVGDAPGVDHRHWRGARRGSPVPGVQFTFSSCEAPVAVPVRRVIPRFPSPVGRISEENDAVKILPCNDGKLSAIRQHVTDYMGALRVSSQLYGRVRTVGSQRVYLAAEGDDAIPLALDVPIIGQIGIDDRWIPERLDIYGNVLLDGERSYQFCHHVTLSSRAVSIYIRRRPCPAAGLTVVRTTNCNQSGHAASLVRLAGDRGRGSRQCQSPYDTGKQE